jgi:hypothetical protein
MEAPVREPIANAALLAVMDLVDKTPGATVRETAWHPDGEARAVIATFPGKAMVEIRDWVPTGARPVVEPPRPKPSWAAFGTAIHQKLAEARMLVDRASEYIEGVATIEAKGCVVSFRAGATAFDLTVSIPRRTGTSEQE